MGELTLGSNRRLCHVCRSPCRETRAGRTKTASFNDHSQPGSIHPKTHLNQAIRDLSWAYVSLHNVPGDTSFDCRSSSLSFSSLNCSSLPLLLPPILNLFSISSCHGTLQLHLYCFNPLGYIIDFVLNLLQCNLLSKIWSRHQSNETTHETSTI